MKRRVIKILVLIWLGWYLTGPVCETFDFWDPPRAEVDDIKHNAGGYVTLVAAIFCFVIVLIRKWRERSSFLPGVLRGCFLPLIFYLPIFTVPAAPASSHSPPLLPLRV